MIGSPITAKHDREINIRSKRKKNIVVTISALYTKNGQPRDNGNIVHTTHLSKTNNAINHNTKH
jgi:hypothetical protein